MAENFYTILTTAGLAAFANAQVSQEKVDFAKIAVGDSKGTYYNPVATATGLVNEVWSGPINSISLDEKNPNWIIVEAVIPATVGGFTVREIGVYNTAGILLAIGKVPETYKPAAEQGSLKDLYLRMILEVSNASAVTLKVDPAVIFASRKYVDEKFGILTSNIEAIASRIGDLNKLETDYKKDVVGAVNEVQQELNTLVESLGFHEPISEVLERGTNEINAPVKTLCSVAGLEGRTIINYAPLFDSGTWMLTENTATTTVTVVQPNELSIIVNDITKPIATAWSYITGLAPGKTYIMSMISTFNAYIDYYTENGLHSRVPVYINGVSQPFTVPTDTSIIKVALSILEPDTGRKTGTFTAKNVQINEGNTAQPFVANMQGITNPTIENIRDNLIPAFNYGGAYHVPGWMYLKVIDHTGASWENNENARVLVPVVPGTKYTFSCIRKGMVGITGNDGSSADGAQHTNIFTESVEQNSPMNCTFTVPAGVNFIRIVFMTTAGGYVTSPMLVKGVTPAAYKPQVREALTVETTLYAGDSLNIDTAGHVVKHAAKKEVMLDGNLDWKLEGGTYTGYKRVQAKIAGTLAENLAADAVKFNGAMLEYFGNSPTKPDQVVLFKGDGNVYLSVANTDSGWGPNYQPTPEEIKAYFMGWEMGTLVNGTYEHMYNGTGTKYWRAKNATQTGAGSVPMQPIVVNGKWQPYKLVYVLPATLSEVVATTGSLTLDEGENMLVVSEGRAVQEVAKPYHYQANAAGVFYDRYEINTRNKSPLTYNTSNILQIYKNGKPDNAWTIEYTAMGYVRALLDVNLFDPTAVYTVDYVPHFPYCVSAPTNAITIEYADKLGGVIQLLVTTAAKLGAQAANMQNSTSFRFGYDEGGLYVTGKGDF